MTRYLVGGNVDQLLARESASGVVGWYLTDRLGSVRDITSDAGQDLDHIDYDAFGNITVETDPALGDRYKFTGREYDSITGLYYNRARYYDPRTGSWTSQDPLGFAAEEENLYRYVANDPIDATDPSGMEEDGLLTRAGRVAKTGVIVGLNVLAWGLTGPIGGIAVTSVTVGLGGAQSYYSRQAQAGEVLGRPLETNEAVGLVGADVTGASAVYTVVQGQDIFTDEEVSTADRLETGAHLVVAYAAGKGTQAGLKSLTPRSTPNPPDTPDPINPYKERLGSLSDNGYGEPYGTPPPNNPLINPTSANRPTKPGSTVSEAATSFDSHARRPGWPGPKPSGNVAAKNAQAQALVDDILSNPARDVWTGPHSRPEWGGTVTEVYRPDGLGVRFDANGQFVGFITRPPS